MVPYPTRSRPLFVCNEKPSTLKVESLARHDDTALLRVVSRVWLRSLNSGTYLCGELVSQPLISSASLVEQVRDLPDELLQRFFAGCLTLAGLLLCCGLSGCGLFGSTPDPDYERLSPRGHELWDRARAARAKGDTETARAVLQTLIAEQPKYFRGLREWQDVMVELGLEDRVEARILDAPDADVATMTLEARGEDDPEKAKALLLRALEGDPDFAWAHLGLAFRQSQEGELDAARRSLERALSVAPRLAEAKRDLASVQYRLGEAGEACATYAEYLELRGDDREVRHEVAAILAKVVGDPADAIDHYRILVDTDDHDIKALMGLAGAILLADEGQDEAISLYERVLSLDRQAMDAYYNLGWIHETQLRDDHTALTYYRRFLDYAGPESEDPRQFWYVVFVVPNRIEALEARLNEER